MPVSHHFDSNIVVIEMIGEYSVKDLRTVIINSFDDPLCPKNPILMIDLSRSKSIYERPSSTINAMATFIATYGNKFNNRLALVAPDDLAFGLMRMSSVSADSFGVDVKIFRTYNEARNWLVIK
jgi:hypothetical protein